MRREYPGHRIAIFLVPLLLVVGACETVQPRSQVMAVIDAELPVRQQAAALEIQVEGGRGRDDSERTERFLQAFAASVEEGGWPRQVAIGPLDDDPTRVFEVTATALDEGDEPIAQVRAIGDFVPEETVALVLIFEEGCLGRFCGEEETCRDAVCVDAHVETSELPRYDPDLLDEWLVQLPDASIGVPDAAMGDTGPLPVPDPPGDAGGPDADAAEPMMVDAGADSGGMPPPRVSAIERVSVTVDRPVAGEQTRYTVELTTSDGLLVGEEIALFFPDGTNLLGISVGAGFEIVRIDGSRLVLAVTQAVDAGASVGVVIDGVVNPPVIDAGELPFRVEGVGDAAAAASADVPLLAADVVPPAAVDYAPTGTGVTTTPVLTFTFAEPMDPSSGLQAISLHVGDGSGPTVALAAASWSSDRVLSVAPAAELGSHADYTVVLDSDPAVAPRDLVGNALASDVVHAFQTASTTAVANLVITPAVSTSGVRNTYAVDFDATTGIEPFDIITITCAGDTDLESASVQGDFNLLERTSDRIRVQAAATFVPVAAGTATSLTVSNVLNATVSSPAPLMESCSIDTTRDVIASTAAFTIDPTAIANLSVYSDTPVTGVNLPSIRLTFRATSGIFPGDTVYVNAPPSFGFEGTGANFLVTSFDNGSFVGTWGNTWVQPGNNASVYLVGRMDGAPTNGPPGDYSFELWTSRDPISETVGYTVVPSEIYVDNTEGEASCNGFCPTVDSPGSCVCGPAHDIDAVLASLQPGHTVHIAPGTYTMGDGISSQAALPMYVNRPDVAFIGEGVTRADTVLHGWSASDFRGVFELTNSYRDPPVRFENLTISHDTDDGGIKRAIGCNSCNVEIENVELIGGGGATVDAGRGLVLSSSATAVVQNMVARDFIQGITINSVRAVTFTDVKLLNNQTGVWFQTWCSGPVEFNGGVMCGNVQEGVWMREGANVTQTCGALFDGVTFTDSDPDGCSTPNGNAFDVINTQVEANAPVIRNCVIENSSGAGVICSRGSCDLGQFGDPGNNVIRNNGGSGLCMGSANGMPPMTVYAAGNTWQGGATTPSAETTSCVTAQSTPNDIGNTRQDLMTVCTDVSDSSCVEQ